MERCKCIFYDYELSLDGAYEGAFLFFGRDKWRADTHTTGPLPKGLCIQTR
jgi:hypothetical protein